MSLFTQKQIKMCYTGSRKIINSKTYSENCILYKPQSKLTASQLRQWNLAMQDVRIYSFRKCTNDLSSFFDIENKLCYCNDVFGLFTNLLEWCLFINTSICSLKGVFFTTEKMPYYSNCSFSSFEGVLSSYDIIELALEALNNSQCQQSLCRDLYDH